METMKKINGRYYSFYSTKAAAESAIQQSIADADKCDGIYQYDLRPCRSKKWPGAFWLWGQIVPKK